MGLGITIFRFLLTKIRTSLGLISFLTIILGALVYIFAGVLPHIMVPGNILAFDLPAFHQCAMTFEDVVNIQSYAMANNADDVNPSTNSPPVIMTVKYNKDTLVLQFTNHFAQSSRPAAAAQHIRVTVYLGSYLGADIDSISLDGKPMDLKSFAQQCLISRAEYIQIRQLRTDVATFLLSANDRLANYILTCLLIGIFLLSTNVLKMEATAYLYSPSSFDRHLAASVRKKYSPTFHLHQADLDIYNACWYKRSVGYRFWQVLGPAVGFLFTVSSLVVALHPSVRNANDLDTFTRGIHVAMIATFLGLLLRIVALEGERVNNKLLVRVSARFQTFDAVSLPPK